MRTESIIGRVAVLGALVFTCLGWQAGCSKKDAEQTITLKGRIEKIQRTSDTSGEITVKFISEKNKEIVGKAYYTAETRVEKNGKPVTFQDLQEGIQVNGQVRSQQEGGQKKYKAILIKIESPSP